MIQIKCKILGDDTSTTAQKHAKKDETQTISTKNDVLSEKLKNDRTSDHSDSSDSVKFVMATTSTSICSAVTQTVQKRRSIRVNRVSSESDDVVEVESKPSGSRSESRSRQVLKINNIIIVIMNENLKSLHKRSTPKGDRSA